MSSKIFKKFEKKVSGVYKANMPCQRHPDQTLVAFALDLRLREAVRVAARRDGRDASTFIRQAIIEKLDRLGIQVDASLAFSPDRSKATMRGSSGTKTQVDAVATKLLRAATKGKHGPR